ncbi:MULTISPECIES: hypothetical protein [Cupriavidus]
MSDSVMTDGTHRSSRRAAASYLRAEKMATVRYQENGNRDRKIQMENWKFPNYPPAGRIHHALADATLCRDEKPKETG